jgi:hypothetical protein
VLSAARKPPRGYCLAAAPQVVVIPGFAMAAGMSMRAEGIHSRGGGGGWRVFFTKRLRGQLTG